MSPRVTTTHLALAITTTSADPTASARVAAEVRRLLLGLEVPGVSVTSMVLTPQTEGRRVDAARDQENGGPNAP